MSCPVFLINLPRDAQRLAVMRNQLDALSLPFEWVEAVYGKALPPAQFEALYDAALNASDYPRPLSAGEVGCYASHIEVWRRVAAAGEHGQPFSLVLEDDVELHATLPAVLAALGALPVRWDMIKLVGRDNEKLSRRWPLPAPAAGTHLVRYRRAPSLTGAYLLSADGARKLLARHARFHRPVDVDIRHWWLSGLRLYGVAPYPIGLGDESFTSSIGDRQGAVSLGSRWRKARGQWRYNLCNAWFNRALEAAGDPFPELTHGGRP